MQPQAEMVIADQLIRLVAEMEVVNQVVPFLLAGELMGTKAPEEMLRALSDTIATKISVAEAGNGGVVGEPLRAALDRMISSTRAMMVPKA